MRRLVCERLWVRKVRSRRMGVIKAYLAVNWCVRVGARPGPPLQCRLRTTVHPHEELDGAGDAASPEPPSPLPEGEDPPGIPHAQLDWFIRCRADACSMPGSSRARSSEKLRFFSCHDVNGEMTDVACRLTPPLPRERVHHRCAPGATGGFRGDRPGVGQARDQHREPRPRDDGGRRDRRAMNRMQPIRRRRAGAPTSSSRGRTTRPCETLGVIGFSTRRAAPRSLSANCAQRAVQKVNVDRPEPTARLPWFPAGRRRDRGRRVSTLG